MSASIKKTSEASSPDWSAINRSFNAKQRKAFNAFVARIRISSLLIEEGLEFHRTFEEYPPGHPMAQAIKAIRELRHEISSIPVMLK